MLADFELDLQRNITVAFILADPEDIVATPYAKTSDGAGGFKQNASTPRPPQTVRLIPTSDKVPETNTSDGRRSTPEFVMLGTSDTIFARYDRFFFGGKEYQISYQHTSPSYEKKWDVVRYA